MYFDMVIKMTINILSFSGGSDSVATLLYCIKNDININEIVYIRDWNPYPRKIMKQYFKYIENKFQVKITTLACFKKFWNKRYGLTYPSIKFKYCKMVKTKIFANYIKLKYGYFNIVILLGIRKNESNKRSKYDKYGSWFFNKYNGTKFYCYYPIFELKNSKQYLLDNDIKLNPIYSIYKVNRVSCKLCIYHKNYMSIMKKKHSNSSLYKNFSNIRIKIPIKNTGMKNYSHKITLGLL